MNLMNMPTINLPQKKQKSTAHKDTDNRLVRKKAYADTRWQKTRDMYIHQHPLCEECLKHNRIYAGGGDRGAIHVHHIKSPFFNGKVDWDKMLDDKNLETVCAKCHAEIHGKEKTNSEIIEMLDWILGGLEDED